MGGIVINRYMGGREITEGELEKVCLQSPQIMEIVVRVEKRQELARKTPAPPPGITNHPQ